MLTEPEQLAVLRGLRNGDREAWTTLYESYSADVWRYVARLVGADEAGTADVVQEVFLAAARSAGKFDASRGTLWRWLTGIAHHQASAYWRATARAARVRQLAEAGAPEVRHLLNAAEPVEACLERREGAELVRFALAELSPDYAALLTGKYLDEKTLEELAAQWGSSPAAIKSKLARARQEFRTVFERVGRAPLPSAPP